MLRRRYGAGEVVLLDSGTSALQLALEALGTDGSGELTVGLPAYSCYDVATAAVGAGVRPLFYDVDSHGLTPDPASLRSVLERGARAVVVAHLYGLPVDWDPVAELAGAHGATLVEDAAQGWGGSYRGRPLGALGELSVLSFGRGKGVTGGSGGALLVRAGEHADAVLAAADGPARGGRGWGDLARLAGQGAFGRPALYGVPASVPWLHLGETRYRAPRPPEGMSDFAAGALAPQVGDRVREEAELRRRMGRRLRQAVSGAAGLSVPRTPEGGESGELRLPVLAAEAARPLLASRAARKLGVMPGYPEALPELEAAWGGDAGGKAMAGAARLAASLFTLPCHRHVGEEDLRRIEDLIREAGALASPTRGTADRPTGPAAPPMPDEDARRRA